MAKQSGGKRPLQFFQTTCVECGTFLAVLKGQRATRCPACGTKQGVPSPSKLVSAPDYEPIPEQRLPLTRRDIRNLEAFGERLLAVEPDPSDAGGTPELCLEPDLALALGEVVSDLQASKEMTRDEVEILYSALAAAGPEHFPPSRLPLPGVGPEVHRLFTHKGTTHLLVLGAQPAVLFSGPFFAAAALDIILEIFELFIIVAFGVKPGLKKIGEVFGDLVKKIGDSPKYKALIEAIVKAAKNKNVSRVLEKLHEFIKKVFSDDYDELVKAVKLILRGTLTLWNLLWTLVRWLARGLTGGSALVFEVGAWLIGFAIKFKNA